MRLPDGIRQRIDAVVCHFGQYAIPIQDGSTGPADDARQLISSQAGLGQTEQVIEGHRDSTAVITQG
jgi:hypothetical protein